MSMRKTKPIYLFKTGATLVAYESKGDLIADLALCEQITGAQPTCEVTEVPLVVSSGSPSPTRKRTEYPAEFESYWETYQGPKKHKGKIYQEWAKTNAPA